MKLTIHRGSHQIGGSCVEIVTGTTRIILDVGLPLDDLSTPAVGRLEKAARVKRAVLPVPGLFRPGAKVDAVLISHVHADHTGLLGETNPDVPVYLNQGTSKMLLAGSIFAAQTGLERQRQRKLEARVPVTIGDITVTPFAVDHSAFDSLAFLIEADGRRVLYSGDLRLHGRKPGMARTLLKAIAEKPVDVLLMEGTHFSGHRERGVTEHELEEKILAHLRSAPALVFAIFSPMHVDRLVSFYKAARRAKRIFVVDVYGAFVMHLVAGQARIPRPTASNGIRVYYNQHFERNWERRKLGKVHRLFTADRIELAEILSAPERHLMLFRPSMTKLDFAGRLPERVRCLYSYWNGYLTRPEWAEFRAQVAATGGDFLECHTSGHIFAEDIVKFVEAVNAREVVPIHTNAPGAFAKAMPRVRLVADGEDVILIPQF